MTAKLPISYFKQGSGINFYVAYIAYLKELNIINQCLTGVFFKKYVSGEMRKWYIRDNVSDEKINMTKDNSDIAIIFLPLKYIFLFTRQSFLIKLLL